MDDRERLHWVAARGAKLIRYDATLGAKEGGWLYGVAVGEGDDRIYCAHQDIGVAIDIVAEASAAQAVAKADYQRAREAAFARLNSTPARQSRP